MSEGAVWEAMAFASYYQLDNLLAILDINRLGQSDPAPLQHHVEKYQRRCEAFGWVGWRWIKAWAGNVKPQNPVKCHSNCSRRAGIKISVNGMGEFLKHVIFQNSIS